MVLVSVVAVPLAELSAFSSGSRVKPESTDCLLGVAREGRFGVVAGLGVGLFGGVWSCPAFVDSSRFCYPQVVWVFNRLVWVLLS